MRAIKFRAWVKAGKNTPPSMFQDRDLSLVFKLNNKGGFEKYHADEYELMEYTGLKDKNGVEIYEGDILKVDDEIVNFNTQLMPNGLYEVRYWDGAYCLFSSDGMNIDYLNIGETHCEVIGNIYENRDLLE